MKYFLIALLPSLALANPSDPKVVAGEVSFETPDPQQLTIRASDKSIINWQNFSIKESELTEFIQPSAQATVLNRVVTGNPSNLMGRLESNGKVFLINPNGILVGKDAVINTGSLIASTLDLPDSVFLKDETFVFQGDSMASVINLGVIQCIDGDVVLIGYAVRNEGKIYTSSGFVGLAAGNNVILQPFGENRIYIAPSVSGTVSNAGSIQALQVELKAVGNPFSMAIQHEGHIDARSVIQKDGRVLLIAENGGVSVTGTIDAPEGFVEISGKLFDITGKVDTRGANGNMGTLLIDPNDITISSGMTKPSFSGTFFDGAGVAQSVLNHIELQNALKNNNVTIQTSSSTKGGNGDITFLDPVFWDSAGSLTLIADRDVNVYTRVTNHGFGQIAVTTGRTLNVGKQDSAAACQLGSRLGDLTFNIGGNLFVFGGNAPDAYAHIGYDDPTVSSNINIMNLNLDLDVDGGTADRTFALIGHGGFNAVGGVKSGNIVFSSGKGKFCLCGGEGTGVDAFAQVGHTRGGQGSVTAAGDVILNFLAEEVEVSGGTAARNYSLIGHGGGMSDQGDSFSGNIELYGADVVVHGNLEDAFAAIGCFAIASNTAAVTFNSDRIQVIGSTTITLQAEDGADASIGAQIPVLGSGSGSITVQNIHIEAREGISLLGSVPTGGQQNKAFIGAYTNAGSSGSSLYIQTQGDLLLTAGSGGSGSSEAMIQNGSGSFLGSWNTTLDVLGSMRLQAGKGGASIASIGQLVVNVHGLDLILNSTVDASASMTSINEMRLFAGRDVILTGAVNGQSAFCQTTKDNLQIDNGNNITLNPNSYLRNVGTNNGRIILTANNDLNIIGAPLANSYVENLGNNATWFCANRDVNIFGTIQNNGTGRFVVNAVRDINIGNSTSQIPCQLGTPLGTPINMIAGRHLNVIGGSSPGAYAQIGAEAATVNSTINIFQVGGNLTVQGGSSSGAYAAIGHGRVNGTTGAKTGDIIFGQVQGDFLIQGGSASDAYAQVGHCHSTSSAMTLTGNVQAKNIIGFLHLTGGSGPGAYALFGHGGNATGSGDSYTGSINATANEITVTGGSSAFAGFGFTNGRANTTGNVTVTSSLINVSSKTSSTLQGGAGPNAYAFIGVSFDTTAPNTMNVTSISVDAGTTLSLTDFLGGGIAHIGLFNGNGACGTNLKVCSAQDLSINGSAVTSHLINGNGAPAGTFSHTVVVNGNAIWQNSPIIAIGQLTLNVLGNLSLTHASLFSSNALTVDVKGNATLNMSACQNINDALVFSVGGDLILNSNCHIRNVGMNNGDLTVTANNINITGSGAYVHNLGSGAYNLVALNDALIHATVESPGSGAHAITVGRDLIIGNGVAAWDCCFQTPNALLSVITGRDLTLAASATNTASLVSGSTMTFSVSQNLTLTGANPGQQAYIQATADPMTIVVGNNLVLNPNSFVRHQGGNNNDLRINVLQDLNITGASGANSFIHNLGSGDLIFDVITRDMNVNATIQNPGTGNITIGVSRNLNIGKTTNTLRAQFGTASGDLSVTVIGDLNIIAGDTADAFAQLGGQANIVTGNITINSVSGNLNIIADTALNTFAQIGHRSPILSVGIVTLGEVGGNTTITPGPNPDTYAQVGNYIGPLIP